MQMLYLLLKQVKQVEPCVMWSYQGIPLTMLRGIETWRTSYRKESERTPLHTHIDSTRFKHPYSPSPQELNELADDFKCYLKAVMLGY